MTRDLEVSIVDRLSLCENISRSRINSVWKNSDPREWKENCSDSYLFQGYGRLSFFFWYKTNLLTSTDVYSCVERFTD